MQIDSRLHQRRIVLCELRRQIAEMLFITFLFRSRAPFRALYGVSKESDWLTKVKALAGEPA